MSEEKPKRVFIIVTETVARSWLRDASSYALILAVIGTGVWLDSSAMQWLGFIMLFMIALARALSRSYRTRTISEARAELERLEKDGIGAGTRI